MRLLHHLALNAGLGVLAGLACLAALLWLDPGGLRALALHPDHVGMALPLLGFAFAVTFGGCAAATSIMLLPREEAGGGGHIAPRPGAPAPGGVLAPVQVRARRS